MIGETDSVLSLVISDEEFEITEVNECPVCGELEEKDSVMNEVEFRKGMKDEPDDYYSEGEEGDEVFYMKQVKVCSTCSIEESVDDVFEDEFEEEEEDTFDDFPRSL